MPDVLSNSYNKATVSANMIITFALIAVLIHVGEFLLSSHWPAYTTQSFCSGLSRTRYNYIQPLLLSLSIKSGIVSFAIFSALVSDSRW